MPPYAKSYSPPLAREAREIRGRSMRPRTSAFARRLDRVCRGKGWPIGGIPLSRWRGGCWMSCLRTGPSDLVSEFAQPWALAVALIVTGAKAEDAGRLNAFAQAVFSAAAEPFDAGLQKSGEQATVELARELSSPLKIQAFVALSQALPGFLAHAWLTLLEHPGDAVFPDAMEELLRYATPSRAQFRRALADVSLNGTRIKQGQRVILMLAEANRDPLEFSEPDRFDPRRAASHHVAFGAGAHSCVGAALVRMAATVATRAFWKDFAGAQLVDGVVWREGFALRSPASLRVMRDNRTGGKTR